MSFAMDKSNQKKSLTPSEQIEADHLHIIERINYIMDIVTDDQQSYTQEARTTIMVRLNKYATHLMSLPPAASNEIHQKQMKVSEEYMAYIFKELQEQKNGVRLLSEWLLEHRELHERAKSVQAEVVKNEKA
jgi:hypothetical protein